MNLDHLKFKLISNCWLQVTREDGKDGITWDELQEVKNLVLGKEVTAIEIYPSEDNLVNLKNMRHLWVLPSDVKLPNLKRYYKAKHNQFYYNDYMFTILIIILLILLLGGGGGYYRGDVNLAPVGGLVGLVLVILLILLLLGRF